MTAWLEEKRASGERAYWSYSADEFLQMDLPPRRVLLADARSRSPIFYSSSLNQIFSFRGVGKTLVTHSLINTLLHNEPFLNLECRVPGLKVMLVDGELPGEQLQGRLRELVGGTDGRLRLITPELMPKEQEFPVLSRVTDQKLLIKELSEFQPDIVIFDTLTRCFRFDTGDPEAWDMVNTFLLDLRYRGYCVLILHHAGKNGTQRGRTEGDDNLDVSIKLSRPPMYESEDGCKFTWTWEKVRHANSLAEFSAGRDNVTGGWYLDDELERTVVELTMAGRSQRQIAEELDIPKTKVVRIQHKKKVRTGVVQQ